MISRVTSAHVVALALVASLGAVMVPAAAPASAAGYDCSIVVPPTVWVDRPYKVITATLGSDCAASGASYASWNVRHSYYGPSDIFIFDSTRSNSIGFYDWEHYGTHYVEPSLAYDTNYNSLTQNTSSYAVKSGSSVGVSATRAGSYVTVSTWASYYSPAASAYRMWPAARVQLQYRTCSSTCAWMYLRNVYTASNGKAAYRAYATKTRYYRAVTAANSSIWGRTSAVVIR